MSLNTFITNSMLIQNLWNIHLLFTDIKLFMNLTWNSKYFNILKGDLRSKLHSCFYDISLLTFLKRLTQSFVSFSSVLTKLWNYRILNSAWVTSYWRMKKKHFTPGFLCIFLLTLWRKKLQQSFLVFLIFFPGVMKLQSFECSNCISM